MRSLDVAVIVAYFAAVMAFGLLLAGRQRDATDYFLGHRGLPWWALMMSVVATETSAVTVISVPGLAARGDLTFLQVAFGYLPRTPHTSDSSGALGQLPGVRHPASSS